MNRIVTRGFGHGHLVITRGYGISERIWRSVMRLTSKLGRVIEVVSSWRRTNCA